jgi:small conductance mechanosensitive channel
MLCALMSVMLQVGLLGQISPQMIQQVTAPTTQPAVSVATTKPSNGSNDLNNIPLIQALKGERNLTPDQILQLGFWVDFVKDFVYGIIGFIPKLFVAVFLFFIFWLIYRMLRKILLGSLAAAGMDPSIRDMLGSILRWTILGFGLVIAGNQVGIQIAALLTGVSIVGLAIGFAAQESLQNFIAGIVIFWDKPFKIGDWIEVDATLGQVKRVTFRSTRLENLDGDIVVFPNTYMLSTKVVNKSTNVITRCNVLIGIAYKESIEKAREVLLTLVKRDSRIEVKPQPEVVVKNLNASSVDLLLHFWIKEERYEDAMQYEYLEKAKVALDEAGIEIPFPHMQVLLEQTAAIDRLAKIQ